MERVAEGNEQAQTVRGPATDAFQGMDALPAGDNALGEVKIGKRKVVLTAVGEELKPGAILFPVAVPLAEGAGRSRFDPLQGLLQGLRRRADRSSCSTKERPGVGHEPFQACQKRAAASGPFKQLPRGVVDNAILRLAGAAVGPGSLDADQILGTRLRGVGKEVVFRVENAAGHWRHQPDKPEAAGTALAPTDEGAARGAAGNRHDQKIEGHME